MDHSGDTDYSVVIGTGEQLHVRRFYSHSAGHCDYRSDSRVYLGTQILTMAEQSKKQTHSATKSLSPLFSVLDLRALTLSFFTPGIGEQLRKKGVTK